MRQLVYEKENSEIQPVKLRLRIDLVSYPVWAEGLVNMVNVLSVFIHIYKYISSLINYVQMTPNLKYNDVNDTHKF